ncbi:hypothetical protein DFP72DRAFT_845549 [Ephemerocybe angulata]|uniref:Uncharacterized protein n=1 Tax=Ephemerocybe angulata TaxID=980116 RepID=A0A8H6I3A0_9AGAR|nr:hypothetical protein DFP72DRAFT_845549 [Tulosesus angulatus]
MYLTFPPRHLMPAQRFTVTNTTPMTLSSRQHGTRQLDAKLVTALNREIFAYIGEQHTLSWHGANAMFEQLSSMTAPHGDLVNLPAPSDFASSQDETPPSFSIRRTTQHHCSIPFPGRPKIKFTVGGGPLDPQSSKLNLVVMHRIPLASRRDPPPSFPGPSAVAHTHRHTYPVSRTAKYPNFKTFGLICPSIFLNGPNLVYDSPDVQKSNLSPRWSPQLNQLWSSWQRGYDFRTRGRRSQARLTRFSEHRKYQFQGLWPSSSPARPCVVFHDGAVTDNTDDPRHAHPVSRNTKNPNFDQVTPTRIFSGWFSLPKSGTTRTRKGAVLAQLTRCECRRRYSMTIRPQISSQFRTAYICRLHPIFWTFENPVFARDVKALRHHVGPTDVDPGSQSWDAYQQSCLNIIELVAQGTSRNALNERRRKINIFTCIARVNGYAYAPNTECLASGWKARLRILYGGLAQLNRVSSREGLTSTVADLPPRLKVPNPIWQFGAKIKISAQSKISALPRIHIVSQTSASIAQIKVCEA